MMFKKVIISILTILSIVSVTLFINYYYHNNFIKSNLLIICDQPLASSINPIINIAYVANFEGNTISVIDGKTNSVVNTIKVGTHPDAVSVDPQTTMVYVANFGDNTISVIDGKTTKALSESH